MGRAKLLLTILCLIGSASTALAEFVKLGPLSYASTDQHTLVIISKATSPNSGIFIAVTNDKTSIQEFDPAKLSPSNSRTLFIGYDPAKSGYNKLILPNTKEFSIQGSFTIAIDKTRISIDGNYCSIVTEEGPQPAILGLVGLELVLNLSGETAVALTEGNKFLTQQYKDLIVNFTVNNSGALTLNNKTFDGSRIGVSITAENNCLNPDMLILDSAELNSTRNASDKEKSLSQLRKEISSHSMSNYLSLNTLNDSIIALNFNSGEFGVIREITDLTRVCGFTAIKVK